jgi:tetratricopeptide (TPR) repeat protein
MPESRPGQDADPLRPPFLSDTGTAPTIDPAVPPMESTATTELPAKIGRFLIRGFLGAGAFGTVYRAYDPQLEREVALKVAKAAGQSPERIQRFRREARAAAGLRHPHIVPLFEAGEVDGHLYLASAFVPGKTLEEAIHEQGSKLPPEQAATIVRKLADALAYAHSQGVLHRDVKSANVLLDPAGDPHLLDFGLARRTEDQERMTVAGAVLGTAAYLAPEAARGDQSRWTPAVDQYALGIVLYELLTGHPPFSGPIELVLALHQTQEPERPSRQNPAVPRDLEAICLKCLEKEPQHRYASAGDLAADLDRFRRGEPVVARRQTLRYLAGKFIRRYRRPLAVAAGVVLLAVIGVAAAFVKINAERDEAIQAGLRELEQREKAEQALVDLDQSRKEAEVVWHVVDQEYANVQDDQIRHLKGLGATHEELAALRLKAYQRLAELTPNDPTVLPRTARGHYILGSISSIVGRLDRAVANLQKAADLYEQLEKRNPGNVTYRALRCRALNELGYAYSSVEMHSRARPILTRAFRLAEERLKSAPDAPELLFEFAQAGLRLGDTTPAKTEKARKLALYNRSWDAWDRLVRMGHRKADSYVSRGIVDINRFYHTPDANNLKAYDKLLDRWEADTSAAAKLLPSSPYIARLIVFTHIERGERMEQLGRMKAATAHMERAVAIARDLAKGTPEAGRCVAMLPEALTRLANYRQRRGKIADARTAHEESLQHTTALSEKFFDRAESGRLLIYRWGQFAEFLATASTNPDPVAKAQEVLRARDKAVAAGEKLSARFPNNATLNADFAYALWKRMLIDSDANQYQKALPFAVKLVQVCRERVIPHEPPGARADTLLNYFESARPVLLQARKHKQLFELGQTALELIPHTGHQGKESACSVLLGCAKAHLEEKQADEAISTYQRVIEVATPHLEKHPWHYYLRNHLTAAHRDLADLYRDKGDSRNEVVQLRGMVRVYYDPMTPVRGKQFLQAGRPENAAEAKAIRDEIAARVGGMKRFTVPCDFNGVKYPFHVYVTDLKWPRHPLGDQARWLKEVRGGTVPKEVMDSFERLHKIAHENNVSLQDLCVYALGTANADTGQELKIETTAPDPAAGKESPKLAALKAKAVELKNKLDNAVGDHDAYLTLARTYIEIAEACLEGKQRREAVAAFENGIRMAESALAASPRSKPDVELLARALRGLGRTCAQMGRLDEAVVAQLRYVEVAGQLALWVQPGKPTPAKPTTNWYAERTAAWITLGEIFELRKQPFEAARWYLKGVQIESDAAARKLARLGQLFSPALAAASDDVRAAYLRARQWKGELKDIPDRFVQELTEDRAARRMRLQATFAKEQAARAAELSKRADKYRKLADDYRELDEPEGAIDWLLEEMAIREQQTKLAPADPGFKKAEADTAYRLADLYSEQKRTADAVKWMTRAVNGNHEQAAFEWADWHAGGKNVEKNAALARQWKGLAHNKRGNRLYQEAKYKDAVPDYKAAAELLPGSPVIFSNLAGNYRKLERWDEAITAYRKCHELNPKDSETVLNLLAVMIVGGQPKEVLAFIDKLWAPKPPSTPKERRDLALMHGLHAIANRLTSDEPTESSAEKKLFELTAVPGFKVTTWTWDEIDAWLAKVDVPDLKKATIRRIVEELKGNPQPRSTPFFPLAVGAKWVYSEKYPDLPLAEAAIEVTAKEKVNGVECWKLTRTSGISTPTTEHVVVRYDGIYRMAEGGKPRLIPYRLLALPPARGRVWESGGNKLGLLRARQLEVPAGKYASAWLVQEEKTAPAGTLVRKVWYVENVGPVKVETPLTVAARGTIVLTLKSYQPPKGKPAR